MFTKSQSVLSVLSSRRLCSLLNLKTITIRFFLSIGIYEFIVFHYMLLRKCLKKINQTELQILTCKWVITHVF